MDLAPVDDVKLRQNVAEMGQYMESGSDDTPKCDPVIDIKTCTKKQIYGFFYNLTNDSNTFAKFDTPNSVLKQQANDFYQKTKRIGNIKPGSFSLNGKNYSVGKFEYINTRHLPNKNGDLADVDILLSSTVYFNRSLRDRKNRNINNSTLNKENISFQVEYKDAKCSLIQTSFFEIVQKEYQEDSKSKSVIGVILFVILTIILIIVLSVILLIKKIGKKTLGK